MEIDDQKLTIASDMKDMAGKNEEVEKDSGMEESMGTSPESETQQQKEDSASDSDDDICVRSHQKQSRVIADDDDDDDNGDNNDEDNIVDSGPVPELAAEEDDAPLVLVEEESDDGDSMFIIKKKKKSSKKSPKKSPKSLSEKCNNVLDKKDLFRPLDDDIFDANGTDSEDDSSRKDRNSDEDQSDVEENNDNNDNDGDDDDDEGIDTEALSAKLKSILKKGASKKPKKQQARASKTMAEEKMQLHSETQRLIRESKTHIPYHKPESKSLSDFLNRAMRKQQQYRALKVSSQDERRKVEFVQDTITHDSIHFKRVSLESATQNSQEDPIQVTEDSAPTNPGTQSPSQATEPTDSSNTDAAVIILGDSEALPNDSLPETSSLAPDTKESPQTKECPETKEVGEQDESDEELPDLEISEEPAFEEDSTKNVVEPEVLELFPTKPPVEESSERSVPEEDMEVEDPSTWTIDENGLLKTDDPLMDRLVAAGYQEESMQENSEASLGIVDAQEEKKETDKSEETKKATPLPKLSVSRLLTPEMNNIKPKLSGSWDQPIVFDDDNPKKEVKNPGLDKLMQRLLEHAGPKKEAKETSKKVNIQIIQKEETDTNKQELCLNTVTYQTDEPEDIKIKSDIPGAKLLLLKDKLQVQMRVKRESARQKRCEIFQMNNEEGFDEGQVEENEEEEAELTDGSDTDVSEEEDLIENDMGEDYGKEQRSHSAFVDEEAEEEEEEEEEGEENNEDADDEEKTDVQPKRKRQEDGDEEEEKLLFDDSDSDSDSLIPESQNRPRIKKIIRNLILSDEESANASIQYKETKAEKDLFQKTDFGGAFPSTTSTTTSTSEVEPKTPSATPFIQPLTMPADDSQDLYKSSSDFQSPELNSLRFPLESQASPMFDEQGFLRVKTLTKTVREPKISALNELCDDDDNADDILGLCSGKFSGTQDDRMKSCRTLFGDSQTESQFPATGSFPFSSQMKENEKKDVESEEETEDFPSLKLMSDDEEDEFFRRRKNKRKEKDDSSENEEGDGNDEEELGEEDEEDLQAQAFQSFRMKSSRKIRQEFVDAEAELSGSEYDSDEDDNLNDEYDVMEEEEGDLDVNLTEDQLRNQVNRVHLKNMIDDDKREVMRLQEMYLPDGDLFSEGNGRTRRFRWKGLDDNSQQDMFNDESDTEDKEEEETNELKWRIERFEREKWMQEQEVQEKKNEEESPFLKFGRVFLKKKGTSNQNAPKDTNDTKSPKQSKADVFKNFSKKGSFLSRSRDTLAKIAEMTKPVSNTTVTNKTNGRNFLFSVVTPETEKEKEKTKTTEPEKEAVTNSCPPAKKRKIDPVKRTLSETSVFRHIDKSFT